MELKEKLEEIKKAISEIPKEELESLRTFEMMEKELEVIINIFERSRIESISIERWGPSLQLKFISFTGHDITHDVNADVPIITAIEEFKKTMANELYTLLVKYLNVVKNVVNVLTKYDIVKRVNEFEKELSKLDP